MGSGGSTSAKAKAEAPAVEGLKESEAANEDEVRSVCVFEVVEGRKMSVVVTLNPDRKMDKMTLRSMYQDSPQKLFDAAYKLFDWSKESAEAIMNVRSFVMIMLTLIEPLETFTNETIFELAFSIFDPTRTGALDRKKFELMLNVLYTTHESALRLIFANGVGREMLRDFAAREATMENVDFYDALRKWDSDDGRSVAAATAIIHDFIGPDASQHINISAKAEKLLRKAYDDAGGRNATALPPDLFSKAKSEITKILETNTIARFKKSHDERTQFADALFRQLDAGGDGFINKAEYFAWATTNAEATMFYKHLINTKEVQQNLMKDEDLSPEQRLRIKATKRRHERSQQASQQAAPPPSSSSPEPAAVAA